MSIARNPYAEARSLLPAGHDARVLEPSPPSHPDSDWFADDPTDPAGADGTLVTPIPEEGTTWAEIATSDTRVAAFAAEHWLDGGRPLPELPDGFAATRDALHQIAFFVVAPVRHAATGKLGLRFTQGGFGTPFFRADEQLRVEGGMLVHQTGDSVQVEPITSVGAAARFLGIDYREEWFEGFHDPLSPIGPDAHLDIDLDSAAALAEWFGFATHVLERARRTDGGEEVSRVQLWPEHFDPALEMGSYEAGHRASYGASPGDAAHPEPYLFVSAWGEVDRADRYWNDSSFNGASLGYADLLATDDPYDVALSFFAGGHRRLTG